MMNRVLFLCSGNYYRSRFAEYLFNSLAESDGLAWRADSRGLSVGCAGNIGPISRYAIERLHALGISINDNPKLPRQLAETDLAESNLIIALKEAEHRPLLAALFPSWMEQIVYWHIDDLDCAEPEEALSILENEVRALVGRLETSSPCSPRGVLSQLPVGVQAGLCLSPVLADR
jgi:protein-tyrosine phosphatase